MIDILILFALIALVAWVVFGVSATDLARLAVACGAVLLVRALGPLPLWQILAIYAVAALVGYGLIARGRKRQI